MKNLLDYECANSFLDLLIASIEEKLDINIDDYPLNDDGTPIIDNIMVEYLGWAVAVASFPAAWAAVAEVSSPAVWVAVAAVSSPFSFLIYCFRCL